MHIADALHDPLHAVGVRVHPRHAGGEHERLPGRGVLAVHRGSGHFHRRILVGVGFLHRRRACSASSGARSRVFVLGMLWKGVWKGR